MSSGRAGDRGPLILPPVTWSFDEKRRDQAESLAPYGNLDGLYPG